MRDDSALGSYGVIAPGYYTEDWFKLDFQKETDWEEAIDVFEKRIRGRFLDVVEAIKDQTFSGYSVLALDCLLIETLQKFRKGITQKEKDTNCSLFKNFFKETEFSKDFNSSLAEDFYRNIRCGILHNGEPEKGAVIRTSMKYPLVSYSYRNGSKHLVINRKLFHEKLVLAFEKYLDDLRNLENKENKTLRNNFRKKMDSIASEFQQ